MKIGLGLLLIIIVAIVLLYDGSGIFQRLTDNNEVSKNGENPQQILDARLARGEIDVEEYQTIRSHLNNSEVV